MIKNKVSLLLAATAVAAVFVILSAIPSSGFYSLRGDPTFTISVFFAVILITYGIADTLERNELYDAEKHLPDFLRDIAEFTTFGMPVSEAVMNMNPDDYGALAGEIRGVSSRISLGVTAEEAFQNFGSSLKSDKIRRVAGIIQKASESGSNTSDVLSMASEFMMQTHLVRSARVSEMKNYTLIMIISYGVFLFVILSVDLQFLAKLRETNAVNGSFFLANAGNLVIEKIFSLGILIQGGTSGIISGVLKDGRISSGTLLAGILIAFSIVILTTLGVI